MKYGISTEELHEMEGVFQKFPAVEKVVLYGSRAKGTQHSGSDIDLAIFGSEITHDDILQLGVELDELEMLYTIDVLHYPKLKNPELKAHIDRVGKEIYRAEEKHR